MVTSYQTTGGSKLIWLLLLAVVAVGLTAIMTMGITVDNSHAVERHGVAEVEIVRQCFGRNGTMQLWTKEYRDRELRVCQLENGGFALHILEKGVDEVTGFIRTRQDGTLVKSVEELMHYLRSSGWTCSFGC